MLTNAQIKVYASLALPKGRTENGMFMAQGFKCVKDTLTHFELQALLMETVFSESSLGKQLIEESSQDKIIIAKRAEILKISTLSTPPPVIAIYKIPDYTGSIPNKHSLYLALDCIQDPGNLGTIIRVSDWMGVRDIYASENTVDVWSPKVVQASMGAISRVKVHYVNLPRLLMQCENLTIYGTFLDGENIYKAPLSENGIIVMGNEGQGISEEVAKIVTNKLFIPSFPVGETTSESLNVAIATAITLSEFRRNG